jgi:hypothetical protein
MSGTIGVRAAAADADRTQQAAARIAYFRALQAGDLAEAGGPPVDWIWQGYIAKGSITLLTSQWKAGKTTLISVLLERLGQGGQLAGLEVQPGRAAVVSEEGPLHWYRRSQRLDFGRHVWFFCRPFAGKPDLPQWRLLVERLVRMRHEQALDLVVIDPLARLLPPGTEYHPDVLVAALAPLEELASSGAAVLLLHHPRKGVALAGQSSRGTGALCAYVDVLIEMCVGRHSQREDRRRQLCAWSRFEATPPVWGIELSADGRDYLARPEAADDELDAAYRTIEGLLGNPPRKLSRSQLLRQWPGKPPSDATLWRLLDRLVRLGMVCQEGKGGPQRPFFYFLPAHPDAPVEDDLLAELDANLSGLHELLARSVASRLSQLEQACEAEAAVDPGPANT